MASAGRLHPYSPPFPPLSLPPDPQVLLAGGDPRRTLELPPASSASSPTLTAPPARTSGTRSLELPAAPVARHPADKLDWRTGGREGDTGREERTEGKEEEG
eukprot:764353-Hanusia_phi.AAC.1